MEWMVSAMATSKYRWILFGVATVILVCAMSFFSIKYNELRQSNIALTDEIQSIKTEIRKMDTEVDGLVKQNAELTKLLASKELEIESLPRLTAPMIERLYDKGLEFPEQDIVLAVLERTDLIPYDPVLGGTMMIERVYVIGEELVLSEFSDGHIMGYSLLQYHVVNDGELRFEEIYSKLH